MKDQDFIFIADEACISNDRYTVVGGILLHKSSVDSVLQTMTSFRDTYNMRAELKWSKISYQKIEEYKFLVDYFFALNNTNLLQFHAIIFDSHQANHKKYNNGDRDVGLSKLYYQLMLHRLVRRCGEAGTCYARLDKRNSSTSLSDLRDMINNGAANFGITGNPLKQIVPVDSKTCDILQLNDVILGAVGAARNGKHLIAGGNQAKKEVARLVLSKFGLDNYDKDTHGNVTRVSIWNFKPKENL